MSGIIMLHEDDTKCHKITHLKTYVRPFKIQQEMYISFQLLSHTIVAIICIYINTLTSYQCCSSSTPV